MAKKVTRFICQSCGSWHSKWAGKCDDCGEWNTLVEEIVDASKKTKALAFQTLELFQLDTQATYPRLHADLEEFDRVCGGGLVPGSVLLIGGDPGIGKSTILLQVLDKISHHVDCLYVSGEEGPDQIRMRANRLGIQANNRIHLACETRIEAILQMAGPASSGPNKKLLIIDSIQTMTSDQVESAPGTVTQVRTCAHELIQFAKKEGVIVILVGHVTKEGVLAGPRVLEHMVDTVLYFEGDQNNHYRILRAVKNRFGPTNEIGIFEMTEKGLMDVPNPSALFLSNYGEPVSGSAILAGMEGTRTILTEIQALVTPSYLPSPRRTAVGWDTGRLSMLLAVLESRCGLIFGNKDVYLNVVGGRKMTETAADLPVIAALISALHQTPVPEHSVFFAEVGLVGEIRPVAHVLQRLKEAEKLGFMQAFYAPNPKGIIEVSPASGQSKIKSIHMKNVKSLVQFIPKSPKAKAPSSLNEVDQA